MSIGKINKIVDLKYDNTIDYHQYSFWEKTIKLNKANLKKIGFDMLFIETISRIMVPKQIYFQNVKDYEETTPFYDFHQIELINKQYRLLQELYYSRLEEI